MSQYQVFVSHSHADAAWCSAFVSDLRSRGLDVWYDEHNLYVGEQWVKTIEQELSQRELFILIISPDSWASKWVQRELSLALTLHKQIIGIIHRPIEVSGFITTYQLLFVAGKESKEVADIVVRDIGFV